MKKQLSILILLSLAFNNTYAKVNTIPPEPKLKENQKKKKRFFNKF